MAAPLASRPHVLLAGQQKDSPGHSTFVGSAHPGLGLSDEDDEAELPGLVYLPETVVQVLPRGQHPTAPFSAVKHFWGATNEKFGQWLECS